MTSKKTVPLLVGEVFVDYTITEPAAENKLRLGGVVHAARGLWAVGAPFSVAAVLPGYLEGKTRDYLAALGCVDFHVLGYVLGAPNVTAIFDATEVADQGYETLLRDEKSIVLSQVDLSNQPCRDILIFPGTYDLNAICQMLPATAQLHLDIAYDIDDVRVIKDCRQKVQTILISTSSALFRSISGGGLDGLRLSLGQYASVIILKENRGGTRMLLNADAPVERLPAQLGATVNSVGVGDVFAAVYVATLEQGCIEAGWRASYAAAAYSQTTYPDLFKTYVQRDLKLTVNELQELGGVLLAWEKRRDYPIYLAAPDFSYGDRKAVDKAIASLEYHNFVVRRPILENGELPRDSDTAVLRDTYQADCALLKKCSLVFAVPTARDPGTLVEIGISIEAGVPVIVYDPSGENRNTMVIAGPQHYSPDLDSCLNAVFSILSGVDQS